MRRTFRPIRNIVEHRTKNSCTDWMLYDMIDELAGKYFYFGLAIGIVAGAAVVVALIGAKGN